MQEQLCSVAFSLFDVSNVLDKFSVLAGQMIGAFIR